MSINIPRIAVPFALATALLFSGASLAADSTVMHDHDHDHGEAPFEMRLNNGEKWAVDAPLRQAMGDISEAMRQSLPAIHEDRLPAEDYIPLANQVNDGVAHMIANCELPPEADAQLHMVIAQLMAGSEKMAAGATPREGAVQVLGALDAYAQYFDDPDFVSVIH